MALALGAAMVGLIPGLAYLTLFLCGVFGAVNCVGLLAERLTAWFAPMVIVGLILSTIAGLSSGALRHGPSGLRTCVFFALLLMIMDVPLLLVQLVSLFAYYD